MENPLPKVLTIVAFFIIGLIVVWGAYNLARLAAPSIASFFSRIAGSNSALTVTLSRSSVPSETPVDVSWEYRTSKEGHFALVYPCRDDIEMNIPLASGDFSPIPCGVSFPIPEGTTKVPVVPVSKSASPLDVPITITFIPQAASGARAEATEGSAKLTVLPGTGGGMATATSTPATSGGSSVKPGSQASTPAAPADLRVTILSIGIIDPYTNQFSSIYPTSPSQTAAARIRVTNAGGTASGAWSFDAELPTSPFTPYTSPTQASLKPGWSGEYVLTFGPVAAGGGLFSVAVDPSNAVRESNENNNTASEYVNMSYYTGYDYTAPSYYNYNQPYYYNDYNYYGGQYYDYQYPYYTY